MINRCWRFWQYQRGRFLQICEHETPRLIFSVPSHNPTFVSCHFTKAEITHCCSQPSPPLSFAAHWVGKEAVSKLLGVKSKGVTAAMKDIEITCMVKPKPEPLASLSILLYLLTWNLFFLFPSFFLFMPTCAYLCYLGTLVGFEHTCGDLGTICLRKASSTKYRKVAPSSTRYSKVVPNTLK